MFARERARISGTSHPSPAVAVHIERNLTSVSSLSPASYPGALCAYNTVTYIEISQ